MKSHIFVINLRKVMMSLALVCMLFIIAVGGDFVVSDVMETTANNRLLPIYSVETADKMVAITFDCAWGADDIPDIINTLNKNDVKAAFFMVGDWIEKYPDAVELMHENGMDIGNHSDSHAHVNNLSYEANIADMNKCNDKIKKITGEDVKLYRGPYGEYNNTVITAAEKLNMKVIQWDVDTLDYTGKTAEEMCDRIKKKIRNGSIILMHNDTKYTASGLQKIIDTIKELGYEIVPVSEMIYYENYKINHEGRQISEK